MKTEDFSEFEKWVRSLFNDDQLAYTLVYQIFEALKDKQMTGVGVIVETEPSTIKDSDVANLALHLTEHGLQFKRKRDTI